MGGRVIAGLQHRPCPRMPQSERFPGKMARFLDELYLCLKWIGVRSFGLKGVALCVSGGRAPKGRHVPDVEHLRLRLSH
ncbi:protein of unknown function [Bradyrhizobium vignae]|uniref:Uncharacterized protein n=1 Tax=Bradyrhizobium vignae TaxID=1549949 RepID=A0A2U3QCB1_9BRAD|nr:protein of unknown function [Bradyrhizobium vignae]